MAFFDRLALLVLGLCALAGLCGLAGLVRRSAALRRAGCFTAAVAFAAQTVSFVLGSHAALPGGLSLGAYLQISAWFLLLCGMLAGWKFKMEEALLFAALSAFLLNASAHPLLYRQIVLPTGLSAAFYALHIGALFLSLSVIALAFAAGTLFLYLHRKIKTKERLTGFRQDLPALAVLDGFNAFCVLAGFPLYTLGLGAGLVWAGSIWGKSFSCDPKEIVSFLIWGAFALLFRQRALRVWQGRKPALFVIGLFALCVFSMVVVNIFLPTHHAFLSASPAN
jgi:ABC-type transport system involved in cytochrome c biogenesis permease subunit